MKPKVKIDLQAAAHKNTDADRETYPCGNWSCQMCNWDQVLIQLRMPGKEMKTR